MELWSPLPLYEGVFYRRTLSSTIGGSSSGSSKLSDLTTNSTIGSANQQYTYNNHVLQGCNLWYNPRDLKPRDIGRYRLVLVEGTHLGRMRGVQLSLDSELKSYTLNNSSPLPSEGCKYCIEVTGISHSSQLEERWQIITTSEETQLSWMELLKKARSFADIAEASGEAEKLRELTRRMKEGLVVRKRISSFKLYNNTIVGSRAVRWIMQNKSCTLPQALAIGNRMLNLGLIYHVAFEHLFYAKSLLYQFAREFDPIVPSSPSSIDLDVDDLTTENHSLLSSFHVLQRECLRYNSLLLDLQTHTATLQQSCVGSASSSRTLQTYQRVMKSVMLLLLILISIIFVHVDFDPFSLCFFSAVFIALICVLTITLTPILYPVHVNNKDDERKVLLKMRRQLSDALKQSQEVDYNIHHRGGINKGKTKPVAVAVMPTINETADTNNSDSNDESYSVAASDDDQDAGYDRDNSDKEGEDDDADDAETIDSCNSSDADNNINSNSTQQLPPNIREGKAIVDGNHQNNCSKAKQILLRYSSNPEQEWPNYPLLIRRSSDMLAKSLSTSERDALLQPLHLHRKELSVVDFENDYFIGKAYLIFNNLPDTNQDLFRGKKRQFQTIIQGKFKQSIPFTSLYIGQAYNEQPPQPPSSWLLNGIVKLIPSAQTRLIGNRPYLLSPLMVTMQHIVISNSGEEPNVMDLDLEDDLTLLNDDFLLSCNNNNMRRKKYFSKRSNLAKYSTDPNVVYTFDFYAKQVNFSTFQLEVGIFKHDLIKALGWLPLQIMCVVFDPMEENKKRSPFAAAATSSLSPALLITGSEKEQKKDKEWNFLYNFEVWHQRSLATVASGAAGPLSPQRKRASSSVLLGRVPEEKEWMAAFGGDANNKEDDSKKESPSKGLGTLLFPIDTSIDKDVGNYSGPSTPNAQHQSSSTSGAAGGGIGDAGTSNKLRIWLNRRGSKG